MEIKIGVNGMITLPEGNYYSYDIESDTIKSHNDLKDIREKRLPHVRLFGWGYLSKEFRKEVTTNEILRLRAETLFNRDGKISLIVGGNITYTEYVSLEVAKSHYTDGVRYEYKVNSYEDLVKVSREYHIKLLSKHLTFESDDIAFLNRIRAYSGEGKVRSGFTIVY